MKNLLGNSPKGTEKSIEKMNLKPGGISMETKLFNKHQPLDQDQIREIVVFLHTNLEQYTDPQSDIKKAIDYALSELDSKGGFVLVSYGDSQISGAVVVNHTGMEGYIPENILIYIAIRPELRGKGLGKALIMETLEIADSSVCLHVEPENPARFLYERLGFENKYLDMRYHKRV